MALYIISTSHGGNIVQIQSQSEQDWLNEFIEENLPEERPNYGHPATSDSSVWIGEVTIITEYSSWFHTAVFAHTSKSRIL